MTPAAKSSEAHALAPETETSPDARAERARALLDAIALDAREGAAEYLDDARVPEGGELGGREAARARWPRA